MNTVVINGKEVICADVIEWSRFKQWVENTALFQSILQHSGNPAASIEAADKSIRLDLSFKKIHNFEELPTELLLEFYKNSPWNNNNESIKNLLT